MRVVSDVPRDILHSAELFGTPQKAIWEYVSNALQYVDDDATATVEVTLDTTQRKITIQDYGRGMTRKDLEHFFTMHGQNRVKGKKEVRRGYFGTGKSAAFGIGKTLRVSTTRDGLRNTVVLKREAIERAAARDHVPVTVMEQDVPTREKNGTTIEIERLLSNKRLNTAVVETFLEQQVRDWMREIDLRVNGRQIIRRRLDFVEEAKFSLDNHGSFLIGANGVLRLAPSDLPQDDQGIAVMCNGLCHDRILVQCAVDSIRKRVFGEVDVPRISDPSVTPSPLTMARAGLNEGSPLVQELKAALESSIIPILERWREEEERRKSSEEKNRYKPTERELSLLLSVDFQDLAELENKRSNKDWSREDARDGSALVSGDDGDVKARQGAGGGTTAGTGSQGHRNHDPHRGLDPAPEGTNAREEARGATSKPRTNIVVRFEHLGTEVERSTSNPDSAEIVVNLDHPVLASVIRARGEDSPDFRRAAIDVVATEYSIFLAYRLLEEHYYNDPVDYIIRIDETIERVTRLAVRHALISFEA